MLLPTLALNLASMCRAAERSGNFIEADGLQDIKCRSTFQPPFEVAKQVGPTARPSRCVKVLQVLRSALVSDDEQTCRTEVSYEPQQDIGANGKLRLATL